MKNNYKEIIADLKEKVKKLITLYNDSKVSEKSLRDKNLELENKLKNIETEYNKLELKYNNLKIAKTVLVGSEDTHDAKIKINRIVREIDNCIALLNR